MKILSIKDANAIAAANKLRMYPGGKRGRARLLPFARPVIHSDSVIAEDASFFVAGNCFARSIEKALKIGGKTLLSSPYNPEMPGDAVKQFQRYNIFNLDIAANEIEWATQSPEKVENALIRVGDELVDMQLHFTVAYPPDEMRRIRRIYNSSYAAVADADVVIGVVGSARQWFDTETGIYMNVQPTLRMTTDYPGRFEFHEFDAADIEARLHRFRNVVRRCNPEALLLIMVSPVSQPSTFSSQDALVSQYHSKCLQRVAVSNFLSSVDDVEYVAALESAFLSDFRFTFQENNPNHTLPNLGLRVTADMLRQRGDVSLSQQIIEAHGYGQALLIANEAEAAADLLAPLTSRDGHHLLDRPADIELHRTYVMALTLLERYREALDHLLSIFQHPQYEPLLDGAVSEDEDEEDGLEDRSAPQVSEAGKGVDHLFNLARVPLFKSGDKKDFEAMLEYATRRGYDTSRLAYRQGSGTGLDKEMKAFVELYQTGDFERTISRAADLQKAREDLSPAARRQLDTMMLQAHVKMKRAREGIDRLLAILVEEGKDADKRSVTNLCNIGRSHATPDQIDAIIALAREVDMADVTIRSLEESKLRLQRKRAAG